MDFLYDTNIVVAIAFLIFVGILAKAGVHKLLATKLDERADTIKSEIDEARALREEAQTMLASYERKQKEVEQLASEIVASAKAEAQASAVAAKEELAKSIERRVQAAKDQISSAEASALREVKDRAVTIAVAAAGEVLSGKMTAANANALIDASIKDVSDRLN